MSRPLLGLTWDHPRGWAPLRRLQRLDAAASGPQAPPRPLRWERQPLEGFESAPISALTPRYDVLVVDHPGLGEAVGGGCLTPLDELFGAAELDRMRTAAVARSFESYRLDGRQWALPLDAAAQVGVARPDLLGARPPVPATWAAVRELSREVRLTLCLGGPHALLMLCALCAAQGAGPGVAADRFAPADAGLAALDLMADLLARADRQVSLRNPIGVLEALAEPGGPAYCPLVFGYVTYQVPAGPARRALAAGGAPAWQAGGRPGSVLGGTGLAVSRRVGPDDRDAVRWHLRRLVGDRAQRELLPAWGGQPSARSAWTDPGVNARSAGFYAAVLPTLEAAWVRPRFAGWIPFQRAASAAIRDGLQAGSRHTDVLSDLDARWRRVAPRGGASATTTRGRRS
jgi:multiple sugar transport system substrate-binding protein